MRLACLAFVFAISLLRGIVLLAGDSLEQIPFKQLGKRYEIVGKLHKPLGQVAKIQGVVIHGPSKGCESGPNLRVQRIDGRVTQEDITISLEPYFGEFPTKFAEPNGLPELRMGNTYEFEGYETGAFVGVPPEAYKRAGIVLQTHTSLWFCTCFQTYKGERIDPIVFSPEEFVSREMLVQGRAVNMEGRALVQGDAWRVRIDSGEPWPTHMEGKLVEVLGIVRKGEGENLYEVESSTPRLVRLEDQVGRQVVLRGTGWSMNGRWWFNYRGTDLYVENLENLPGWSAECHGGRVQIAGRLETGLMPRIDQITLKEKPDLKEYYLVRSADWKPVSSLLSPECADDTASR